MIDISQIVKEAFERDCRPINIKPSAIKHRRRNYLQIVAFIVDGKTAIATRNDTNSFERAINYDTNSEIWVGGGGEISGDFFRTARPATFDEVLEFISKDGIRHEYNLDTLCYCQKEKSFFIHSCEFQDEDCNYDDITSMGKPVVSINIINGKNSNQEMYYDKKPK